ncbi:MAG: type II secretion system F family protein [Gluconacetobacter diazotrophicus]|nr:type II secretion system F family protein [Gluconacetobacter diazotrophicus]
MGPSAVIAGLSASLLLAGGGLLLFGRNRARENRVRARFGLVLDAYAPPKPPVPVPSLVRDAPGRQPAMLRLGRLFGIEPGRVAHLPARPAVLVGVSLLFARLGDYAVELMLGTWGLLLLPVLWVLASRALLGWFARRHARLLFTQFPDALAMIVRAVRIGIPVSQAVRSVAAESPRPTADEFARLAASLSIGTPLDEAMAGMAERNGLPEYRFFAAALTLQNQTGGGLAATLENLADVIRKRVYARAKGYALAAEARMSATVLTVLPVITFLALLVLNFDYVSLLFTTANGHLVFGAALALLGMGQGSMRMLIRRSLS